ncbi:hypothetical protein GCM10011487_58590 [Steroidobacter agaridevorans]|uniref:Uncharacterized protein n=1 Tax=Steroidobacter agaridevorans TaxID=2695856 RepID=A0A829YKY4_9GAMM|nr:hypothetical protein [Steroidobacter agaridevorans]GFE83859.1 hypothetical protein GCM10011487_58590 [Steroidobacter agaridevorans]GFE91554.1 hypothetical protein GCM10011488_65080 [Steroidobacter agaridevorans]
MQIGAKKVAQTAGLDRLEPRPGRPVTPASRLRRKSNAHIDLHSGRRRCRRVYGRWRSAHWQPGSTGALADTGSSADDIASARDTHAIAANLANAGATDAAEQD